MATEKYKKLINGICAFAKIPNPQALYATADLTVDDINFTLIDASMASEDAVAMYCDFGAPPAKNRVGVLERLLQINLIMHGNNKPLFAINSETGHILLGLRIPTEKISALELMTLLAEYSAHAKEWRQTFYLLDSGKTLAKHA